MERKSPRGGPVRFPVPSFPDNVKKMLEAAFNEIDVNKDGRIDEDELLSALQKNGYNFSKKIVRKLMMFHLYREDEVKLASLNFQQFIQLSFFLDLMKNSFNTLDGDKNGCIDEREFGSSLIDLGLPVKREQIKLLMAIVDEDNNGTIEFSEYVDLSFYLLFFSQLADMNSKKNLEEFSPPQIVDLCGLAGVEVSEETAAEFIKKNAGRPLSFNSLLGLLLFAQGKLQL
jgi:Ca2+-binding EF-hand superfamily protein